MATIINNRSNLATDPIRNFRFLVTFLPQGDTSTLVTGPGTTPNVSVGQPSVGSTSVGAGSDWATNLASVPFGFTSVSGMAVSTDSIPYREGGYNTTVHQIPGQTSFAPVTMQRGVILGSDANWQWMRELFMTVQGKVSRTAAQNFRCDIQIDVLSHPLASTLTGSSLGSTDIASGLTDHISMRFMVYNAWITSLAYSDLNAGDNAILVEQMTLVHEGFDVIWGSDLTSGGSAGGKALSNQL